MTTTQTEIKNILKSKNYTVSVDSRVWRFSTLGTWIEVSTIDEAKNLPTNIK